MELSISEYNLKKIEYIDKDIIKNREEYNKYIESFEGQFRTNRILKKISNKVIPLVGMLLTAIVVFLISFNPFITAGLTLIIWVIINIIVSIIIKKTEPTEEYLDKLEEFEKAHKDLINQRNAYVNLYYYSINGDEAIINNIRLRINNKEYFEYGAYFDKIWLNQDVYAYKTLQEMNRKEKIFTTSIKNQVDWELKYPEKSTELSTDKLYFIHNAL
jgi:hypothetical protein